MLQFDNVCADGRPRGPIEGADAVVLVTRWEHYREVPSSSRARPTFPSSSTDEGCSTSRSSHAMRVSARDHPRRGVGTPTSRGATRAGRPSGRGLDRLGDRATAAHAAFRDRARRGRQPRNGARRGSPARAGARNVRRVEARMRSPTLPRGATPAATSDASLLAAASGIDALVEATGDVEAGARTTLEAIEATQARRLVNAELDATLGPILRQRARGSRTSLSRTPTATSPD